MRKRIMSVALALWLVATMLPLRVWAADPAGGVWGDLNWVYDTGTKTLTVSGNGAMPNGSKTPFEGFRSEIENVVIENGVTTVGQFAFSDCKALSNLTLPGTVTKIGDAAFQGCSDLTSVVVPEGVEFIGGFAFNRCYRISNLKLPNSLRSIGEQAFCGAIIANLIIPDGVVSIGRIAFSEQQLTAVYVPKSATQMHDACLGILGRLKDIYFGGTEAEWKAIGGEKVVETLKTNPELHFSSKQSEMSFDTTARSRDKIEQMIRNGKPDGFIDIWIEENIDLGNTSLEIPADRTVRFNLRGNRITSAASPAIVVKGQLDIIDSTVYTDPVVSEDIGHTVTYESGSITALGGASRQNAIKVQGGQFQLYEGAVEASNIAIYAADTVPGAPFDRSHVVVFNGYVKARESAVAALGRAAQIGVLDGVLLSEDNAVISGNGLPQYSPTYISMDGGTLISQPSKTAGYIPCGIYHPQNGSLGFSGGKIYAENGVGILMRGGTLNIGVFSDGNPEIITEGSNLEPIPELTVDV